MHGPASEGAAMSASDVMSRCGTASSSWAAIDSSKIVATIGTSSSRWRTSSASRSGSSSPSATRQTTSGPKSSSASRTASSSGSSQRWTSAPRSSSAAHDLLEEVADAGEQHSAALKPGAGLGHGRSLPRVAFRSVSSPDLRSLPPVDALAAEVDAPRRDRARGRPRRARRAPGGAAGGRARAIADLAARARAAAAASERPSLRRVLNATGVIVHTNLGRAPLAAAAREAVARAAEGYANLEWDLERGERGSRHDHVEALLCELTGAEAAMAVNNCAGATLLAAAALAGAGSRDRRLARPARGDRRRLPRARRDRAGRRPAGRGRHDQPHAARRLRARDRREDRRDPARAPVELPPARASCRRSRSRSCASSACR